MKNKKLICQPGEIYGNLTILGEADPYLTPCNNGKRRRIYAQCKCGKIDIFSVADIRRYKTLSCGQGCPFNSGRKHKPHISSARSIWRFYKDGGLTFEEFYSLSQQDCFYCGEKPSNLHNMYDCKHNKQASIYASENGSFVYNGLDRIDNNLPHTKNNVVPCCKKCNAMKSALTQKDFFIQVARIYMHTAKQFLAKAFQVFKKF